MIKRRLYLVPNSIVVSRGCPHVCDFCYKEAFFEGGRSFYTQTVDAALAEIERLPGRHLYFLDDHLFGDRRFATALFDGMRGMGRLWQAAGTVNAVLTPHLLERAVEAGLRSLFVGFESLSAANLLEQRKFQNLRRDYTAAIRRLHDLGVMINGSFVFGMDADDPSVFDQTVDWAIAQGIETATFHILTPYPGTALHQRLKARGRITIHDWDVYDTRHAVFQPARMSADELEHGYWRAYRDFYRWGSIMRGACAHGDVVSGLRHVAYAAGWKKFEPMWDLVIRAKRAGMMLPVLETILSEFGRRPNATPGDAVRFGRLATCDQGLDEDTTNPIERSNRIVEFAVVGRGDIRLHVALVAGIEGVVDLDASSEAVLPEMPWPRKREVERGHSWQPPRSVPLAHEILKFVDRRPGESRPPLVDRREHPFARQANRAAHDQSIGHIGRAERAARSA